MRKPDTFCMRGTEGEYVLLQDGEVKMIDFGFSKMFHGTEETHVALVTASGRPYVHICEYTHARTHTDIHTQTHTHTHIFTNIHTRTYIYVYIMCIRVSMCVCVKGVCGM